MVITSRVHTIFFVTTSSVSETLIRLPSSVVGQYETKCEHSGQVVYSQTRPPHRPNIWSSDEHDRFLHGLELFPTGPWKEVAAIVGTKTTRQTMTHAQKYRQKIERRLTMRPRSKKSTTQESKKTSLVELSMPETWQTSGCEGLSSPVDVSSHPSTYSYEFVKDSSRNEDDMTTTTIRGSDMPRGSVASSSSPTEVWGAEDDLLDSINFAKEFESLIASLNPLPIRPQ